MFAAEFWFDFEGLRSVQVEWCNVDGCMVCRKKQTDVYKEGYFQGTVCPSYDDARLKFHMKNEVRKA